MNDERLMIEEQFEDEKGRKNDYKPKFEFDEKNYFNEKPKKGEKKKVSKIRLLPINGTERYFKGFDNFKAFFSTHIHSLKVDKEISQSGFKKFICLNDEKLEGQFSHCPLCDKSREYYKKANEAETEPEQKAFKKIGSDYRAKKTYIVRVIERGHEEDGVKFWRFNEHTGGTGIFDLLKELYDIRNKESVEQTGEKYNIFDLKNGRDIIVTSTYDTDSKKYSVSIADAGFPTPISKDDEQIMEWINDEKIWTDVYAIKSPEYMQIIADGEIPIYDKTKKKWVSTTESESDDEDEETTEKTQEETTNDDVEEVTEETESNDIVDDLPF